MIADSEDYRHSDRAGAARVVLLVGGERPVELKGSSEMVWRTVSVRVVGHVRVAEQFFAKKIAKIVYLSPGDQLFRQFCLMKPNVPDGGIVLDLVPGFEAGNRYIEDHCPAKRLRVFAKECINDHASDVVSDDVDVLQLKLLRELVQVFGKIYGIVTSGSDGG